jgi:hypothetical protein
MVNKRKRSIKSSSGSGSGSNSDAEGTVIGDEDCLNDDQDLGFNYVFGA